jgi:enamine deaminase RidA (YjgF/YER057c/UK114 family)
MAARQNITSGSAWEPKLGYSRAVKVGPYIHVAGTTGPGATAADQTRAALETIKKALESAGAGLQHVVRTRLFVTDISQWESIGRVHGEYFGEIRPAMAMVQVVKLIDPALLVEIEADAYLG